VAFDCDWVIEELPSIFGKIDVEVKSVLQVISLDVSSDWYTKTVAMQGLAAISINHSEVEKDVFSFLGDIFKHEHEDWNVRQSAGSILLDFMREEYKDDLIAFGKEEDRVANEDSSYIPTFNESSVHNIFLKQDKNLCDYTRNWLSFYDEYEIKNRKEGWERENQEKRKREDKEKRVIASGAQPYVRQRYIGRNDPCPCKSGKKYKKCCLGKENFFH
jgi:hypothetical protein